MPGLKRTYPKCRIIWIVQNEGAFSLLKNNSDIDELYSAKALDLQVFKSRKIDLLINLDEDETAISLASALNAQRKMGFGLNEKKEIMPLNKGSEYAFRLRIDDELKFRKNTLTYPQLIYKTAELEYQNDQYQLNIPQDEKEFAGSFLKKSGVSKSDFILGLVTGAGPRFANKSWTIAGFVELIKQLHQKTKIKILLLGGPDEIKKYEEIDRQARSLMIPVGCHTTIWQLAAFINKCDCVLSGDTAAMHMAVALKKNVVVLFGPTCPQEIDLFGRGIKIVSDIECAPCYLQVCPKIITCMDKIKVQEVYRAIFKFIPPEKILSR